jgi:hypothetical protein
MKRLMCLVFCAFTSMAEASTIAVTGGGILGSGEVFSLTGDNLNAAINFHGATSIIPCREGTTCQATVVSQFDSSGLGLGSLTFDGQTGQSISGEVTVTYSLTVPLSPPNSLTGTASVSTNFTGYRQFYAVDPFFSASVTGEGTVTTFGARHPFNPTDPTYIEFETPGYQFSGTADVTPISGGEVPEPGSLLLVAGALVCGVGLRRIGNICSAVVLVGTAEERKIA